MSDEDQYALAAEEMQNEDAPKVEAKVEEKKKGKIEEAAEKKAATDAELPIEKEMDATLAQKDVKKEEVKK